MKIVIKLVAYVGEPVRGIDRHGEGQIEIPEGTTLADLLGRLDVAAAELYLTLVNDVAVRERDQPAHVLSDGDRVTVFPPIKGG